MFDKMVFTTKIDFEKDAAEIAKRNHLQRCTAGTELFYQTSVYGNFEGIYIKLRGNTMQIKCSLHKLYSKASIGIFDNSNLFTISESLDMIDYLFSTLKIEKENVKVTYYEIGLNMITPDDPLSYIELIQSAGQNSEKEMFNDANYQKYRQKTTEKSKNIKKVLKVYDKGFEARSKGRMIPGNILRCETIYKRQSIPLTQLTSNEYLSKIISRFYRDWHNAIFPRQIRADKGIKASQIEKAKSIMQLGRNEYYDISRKAYLSGTISKKTWETIRVFIQSWDDLKTSFRFEPTHQEIAYKSLLDEAFSITTN